MVPDDALADEDAPLADHYAVRVRAELRDLAASAALLSERRRKACAALAAEQERRYEVEVQKLEDLNALRCGSVFAALRERYCIRQGAKVQSIMRKGAAPLAKK